MKTLFVLLMTGLLGVAMLTGCAMRPDAPSSGPDGATADVDDNTGRQDVDLGGFGDDEDDLGDGDQAGITGIVAQWDFEPGPIGFASLAASVVADNVIASAFTSSDGSPTTTTSQGVNWVTENGWTDETTFLSCTIEAADGFEIRLTSLDFEQSTLNAIGPVTWRLRSGADGFTSDLATGGVLVFPRFGEHTVDLTGITIGSAPVEFRWFTVGATGEGVGWGVDEVIFQGEVAPTG